MSSVMMDRWGLECAFDYLQHGNNADYAMNDIYYHHMGPTFIKGIENIVQQCWDNFLTAIVLWDEIWSSEFPYNWKGILPDTTMPIDDLGSIIHLVDSSMLPDWPPLYNAYNELRKLPSVDPRSFHGRSMSLSQRTKNYQMLSSSLGIPYLAHPYRNNLGSTDDTMYNRNDVIGLINEELTNYYNERNKVHRRKVCSFKYPVLIDYIVQEATSPKEELLAALSLRGDPDIVKFRESMYEIEQSVLRGDQGLIAQEEQLVSDLAEEITAKRKWKGILDELILSLPPALSISFHPKARHSNNPQVTFVRKLLNFGVHSRKRDFFR